MKFLILAFVCVSVVLAAEPTGDHFRNEFDRLLVETSVGHMTKLEHRLLELQSEINHLQANPNKVEQDKVVREMETIIAFAEQSQLVFTRELKRTDLNLVEKYNFESALKTSQTLVKNVKEFEVKVKALGTNPKPDLHPQPVHHLHITVKDFQELEKRLIHLQGEIFQLESSKSKTEQAKIVKEIEDAIAYVNANLPKVQEELKRKDLSIQDQVTFEAAAKVGQILVKDLKEAETKVKAIKTH